MFSLLLPTSSSAPASRRRTAGQRVGCWLHRTRAGLAAVWLWLLAALAHAQLASDVPMSADAVVALRAEVQSLLSQQKSPPGAPNATGRAPWRISFELGELDPRLRLAPCARIQAYLPPGARMWGRTRVGLRCEQGAVRWNVFWPVTVRVWGQAVVAAAPLRPGEPLTAGDLRLAEVDLAAEPAAAILQPDQLIGRAVSRAMVAGQAIRVDDVKARRWFANGDTVTVNVVGDGFRVQAEGRAMAHGDEGQCVRIRAENGRTVCAMPVGERLAELRL